MNDPLDQKLEAAVLNLQNRLETTEVNTLSNFTPPKSYKPDTPKVTRQDVKSIFTGQGMPPLDDDDTQIQEDDPRVKFGASFPSNLTLIQPGTVGQEDLGNVPPTPAPTPPPTCPTTGGVTVVLSGIVSCGCQFPPSILTVSVDGTYDLAWDATSGTFILNDVGSWSLQDYKEETCSTPDGDPETGTFNISASCSVSGSGPVWTVDVLTPVGVFGVFASAFAVPSGTSADNGITCPASGGAGGGTATVSV